MHPSFLKDIAIVLGVAAITSFFSRRLKLPTLLGYMVAGLIIGPYIPIPVYVDKIPVESLSEFGVILVMFAVGLDFRFGRLIRTLPISGITATIEMATLAFSGLGIGFLMGWETIPSLFLGASLAISSTMIVSKVFEEKPPDTQTKDYILGTLIVQDVVAILLITGLETLARQSQSPQLNLLDVVLRLSAALVVLVGVGIFIIPRFVHKAIALKSPEVSTIVVTGICFSTALFVEKLGYSVALGAFLAGVLVAESGAGPQIEHLIRPLKDVFSAIFFVSMGMSVDPNAALTVLPQSVMISLAIIALQFISVTTGGILSGLGLQRSLTASLSLGQIGEFAFIISAVGSRAGLVPTTFHPMIVTVAILTSLTTPLLWKNHRLIVDWIYDLLPTRMRITSTFFEVWFSQLLLGLNRDQIVTIPRHLWISILIDSILLIGLPPLFLHFGPEILADSFWPEQESRSITFGISVAVLILVLIPVFYALVRSSSRLITLLSARVFGATRVDSPAATDPSRRIFNLAIQIIMLTIIGLPRLTVVMPFKESVLVDLLIFSALAYVTWLLWRNAGRLESDIESGGEKILDVLSKQTFDSSSAMHSGMETTQLAGISEVIATQVNKPEIHGKSLREIDLRAKTGAMVIAIQREQGMVHFPGNAEPLYQGDIVYLWGPEDAKTLAVSLIGQRLEPANSMVKKN